MLNAIERSHCQTRFMDKLNMNESVIFHGQKFSVHITSISDHYILSPLLFKIQIQLIIIHYI